MLRLAGWFRDRRSTGCRYASAVFFLDSKALSLDDDTDVERRIVGWRPLESATPLLTKPTHAVVVGGEVFFIADSGWEKLDDDGRLKPGMVLAPAHVLRLAVP